LTPGCVRASAEALPAWSETPAVERARVMFRFRELMQARFEELATIVTREHGKTLAEARGSAYRGIENIEYACSVPTLLMGDTLENLARGVDCETMLQPLGVCVGIRPNSSPKRSRSSARAKRARKPSTRRATSTPLCS